MHIWNGPQESFTRTYEALHPLSGVNVVVEQFILRFKVLPCSPTRYLSSSLSYDAGRKRKYSENLEKRQRIMLQEFVVFIDQKPFTI